MAGCQQKFRGMKTRLPGPISTLMPRRRQCGVRMFSRARGFAASHLQSCALCLTQNSSRRRRPRYLKPESRHLASDISSEFDIYGSGLMEHDGHVGEILKLLDELKRQCNFLSVRVPRRFHRDSGIKHAS